MNSGEEWMNIKISTTELKKKQTELKNTMTEIKKYNEGINIRLMIQSNKLGNWKTE